MPDDRADPRWKTVALGIEVEHLTATPAVQQMIVDAETERSELAEKIVRLDPDLETDRQLFRQHRARIAVLDTWQTFFAKYIEDGKAAQDALQIEDAPAGADEPDDEGDPDG